MMRALFTALAAVLFVALSLGMKVPCAQEPIDLNELRFETIDLFIDPAGEVLVAWQVRLVDPAGRIEVVGVEGGEDPSFAEPPYYDPEALADGEFVLAAFDAKNTGPDAEFRVARLHLAVQGDAPAEFQLAAEVLAGQDGPITAASARLAR